MDHVKNTITHHVNELYCRIYGQLSNDNEVMVYAEQLEKTCNPHQLSSLNIEKALKHLLENNSNKDCFLRMYQELKLKNVREVGPFICLLSKLKADHELLSLLTPSDPNEQLSPGMVTEINNVERLQKRIESRSQSKLSSRYTSIEAIRGHMGGGDDTSITLVNPPEPKNVSSELSTNVFAKENLYEQIQAYAQFTPKFPQKKKKRPLKQLPKWVYERPYLSYDYFRNELLTAKQSSVLPLETLPLNAQEKLVVQDILACLQGNDGLYIKALPLEDKYSSRNFGIDEKMHPSLMDTVNKIVPLCSHYSKIVRFVEEKSCPEYGRVNQALCEGIEKILRDYWTLVCQLERQFDANQLGISRLLFLLQETGYLFIHIARLVTNINIGECTGGAVLSLIHESLRSTASLDQVHSCMLFLMYSASAPFFEILKKWIYRGIICDRYNEFFITSACKSKPVDGKLSCQGDANSEIDFSFYWEENYAIQTIQLPSFLESHVEKILKTGKYLNVVQQCDSSVELSEPNELVFSETDRDFLSKIEKAHLFASKILLHRILKQKDLKGILKSVKRYFLLDQGDFIIHFMDAADGELRKPNSLVSSVRLSSLLELALRTSSADVDPYKDNLIVASLNCDLITQMLNVLQMASEDVQPDKIVDLNPSGLEAFSLDYQVEWPLSLVINRFAMDRYQMLFRHLFYCRHVERQLTTSWIMRKSARRANTSAALWFNNAFILGQRMLTFIQHLQYYMTVEVIEPNWLHFYHELDKADNLDVVLESHMGFLEFCMDDCLLTSPDLLALVGKLNVVCVNFSNFMSHLSDSCLNDDANSVQLQLNETASLISTRPLLHHPSLPNVSVDVNGRSRRQSSSSEVCRVNKKSFTSNYDVRSNVTAFDLNCIGSMDEFVETINIFDRNFNGLIVELLSKIRRPNPHQRNKLFSLAARLDFNGFYTRYATTNMHTPAGSILDMGSRGLSSHNSFATLSNISVDKENVRTLLNRPSSSQSRNLISTMSDRNSDIGYTRPRSRPPIPVIDSRNSKI